MLQILGIPGYTCNLLWLLSQNRFEDVELPVRVENHRCNNGFTFWLYSNFANETTIYFSEASYGSKDPTCPFLAFYSLDEVAEAMSPDGLVVSISLLSCFVILYFDDCMPTQYKILHKTVALKVVHGSYYGVFCCVQRLWLNKSSDFDTTFCVWTIALKMADRRRSDLCVVFTMSLCAL